MSDVLIVDDEAAWRRIVRRVLERDDVQVSEAESAEQALVLASLCPPKVTFCDVELHPEHRDGFWLAGELNRLSPATVVVMMTSKDQVDAVITGVRAGSRMYLVKPVSPDLLRETLKTSLAEHAARVRSGATTRSAPLSAPDASPMPFRVVQPWGAQNPADSTVISGHSTAADAFSEVDRITGQMVRTGGPADVGAPLVIDADGRVVTRSEGL
jgi:DNA-binding response OmpR family regulator